MERNTRSAKTAVVEVLPAKVPAKRGRKKKNEILTNSQQQPEASVPQPSVQNVRRSTRGRSGNLEQSLESESTLDNISLSLDDSSTSINTSDPIETNDNDQYHPQLSSSSSPPPPPCKEVSHENENNDDAALSGIEKRLNSFELNCSATNEVQADISTNRFPIVLVQQLSDEDIPQRVKTENHNSNSVPPGVNDDFDGDVEMKEEKQNESVEQAPTENNESSSMYDEDIVMTTVESEINNQLQIEEKEEEEKPPPEIFQLPVEREKVEFKIDDEQLINFEHEELRNLRRSRRLKSVYVETPPIFVKTETEEVTPVAPCKLEVLETTETQSLEIKQSMEKISSTENLAESKKEIVEQELKKEEPRDDPTYIDPLYDPRLSHFVTIRDNIYSKASDKVICKINKTMKCDCTITEEDIKHGELGCTDNCINRLLFIECSQKCRCGEFCDNQQFQRHNYSPISVFRTEKKGFGLRADADIPPETFIIEYVGEVLNTKQFEKRAGKYSKQKNLHYYFMALRSNAVIDATVKGNISRFINHSCDPNAMTQKWTINGELRVGFFSIRYIKKGEEITFDYQYQRYGKEAQKCYCEAVNCRGWIGENPMSDEENEVNENDDVKSKKAAKAKKVAKKVQVKTKGDESELDATIQPEMEKSAAAMAKENEALSKAGRKIKKRVFHEDIEIDDQIKDLTNSGLKNRGHTINLARLVVRAKSIEARNSLLQILIAGDEPCRRLFLDYNGLRLLHSWMCDINVKTSIPDLHLCIELIYALGLLPITNKTVLRESKVLERIEKWRNLDIDKKKLTKEEKKQAKADKKKNKLKNLSVEGSEGEVNKEDLTTALTQLFDVLEELPTMKILVKEKSAELLKKWEVLKEDFKIPKKQKQEIMKEHEKEAGMDEESWDDSIDDQQKKQTDRFKNRYGNENFRNSSSYHGATSTGASSYRRFLDPTERQQRRQLFEQRMAQIDYEKRIMVEHENNCAVFGLPPDTLPISIPVQVNRVTGEYYNILGHPVPPPPNHHDFKYEPLALSTNPEDYHLPPIDLPDQWKFSVDTRGRIYYYNEKIRQSQWEPPIKIQPLTVDEDCEDLGEPDTDESTTDTEDSEEEELNELLEYLNKKKSKSSTNAASRNDQISADIHSIEEDLEKKIMSNMKNSFENTLKLLPMEAKTNRKSRRGLVTMMKFIRPRSEQDKMYGRLESKRYKEVKERLRRQKKRRLQQQQADGITNINSDDDDEDDEDDTNVSESSFSKKIVDELDILNKNKHLDKMRRIKIDMDMMKKKEMQAPMTPDIARLKKTERPVVLTPNDYVLIKRQFRDDIKEEITKYLLPYRSENCINGRITNDEDYNKLVNKLTFSVLTKESKHCAQSNSVLKATDSVKCKTKEFIKKYMSKFVGTYQQKPDEQDYALILNKY